jgi:hypothetical protein
MTVGMSAFTANAVLDAICNNTSFVITGVFVKLHISDPGSAGTLGAATETTRKAVSFGAAASGAISNDVSIVWTSIAGSQDATHFSLWDTVGPAGGNFIGSGTITANPYNAGDTYSIPIGDLDLSLVVAV